MMVGSGWIGLVGLVGLLRIGCEGCGYTISQLDEHEY